MTQKLGENVPNTFMTLKVKGYRYPSRVIFFPLTELRRASVSRVRLGFEDTGALPGLHQTHK